MEKWRDYFFPKFVVDDYVPEIVFDSREKLVFTSDDEIPKELMDGLVTAMNSTAAGKAATCAGFENPAYVGTSSDAYVEFGAEGSRKKLLVRGWGYLTGTCHLDPQDAADIQDSFGRFVVSCMGAGA